MLTKLQNARIAHVLLVGARGDLALDGNGDLRYGWDAEKDCLVAKGTGPKLARLTLDGWIVTEAGLEFILENLQDCLTKSDERAAFAFLKGNPDASFGYRNTR